MLPGLTTLELGRLRMSVGYGTHKRGRLLTPVEVGTLFQRARDAGASLDDCAREAKLKGTTWVSRFIAVHRLPVNILHLVDWGRSNDSAIGFTTAVELSRIWENRGKDDITGEDVEQIAKAILENGLQMKEVRQIAQIHRRSQRSIEDCLKEVLGMRPIVDRRYVFVGAVIDEEVRNAIAGRTQAERNALLQAAVEAVGLGAVSGRLGPQLFTLVGDEQLNDKMRGQGWETIEVQLRDAIRERVAHA